MRLIDADALLKKLNEERIPFNSDINSFIISAPTVEPESKWVILTADYLRGFHDGVTHKDTPAADACRQIEKITTHENVTVVTHENVTDVARALKRYCLDVGETCKGCPLRVNSLETICLLHDGLPEDWPL